MKVESMSAEFARIRSEMGRTIVGYHDVLDDLLMGLLARGHVLLEGVPGIAKTTLARTFAEATGLKFRRIQFTQDLLPADITGHWFFNQKTQEFELRPGAVFSQFLLADEINRAPPKTQSALLEAMEERQVTIEGTTHPLDKQFLVVATMNPVDVEGVYRLPEAQLDRFLIRTRMGYLSVEQEQEMLLRKRDVEPHVQMPLSAAFIEQAQEAVRHVRIEKEVVGYLHAVALATRAHPKVTLGASPRAMEQLLQASRASALLDGRDYVIPDDVKRVAPRVLNHRIILHVEAEIEGLTSEAVVAEALRLTEVPKTARR